MKSCAIAIFCLIILGGFMSAGQASSKLVQHEQVTVFIEDYLYHVLGSETFTYDSTSACEPTLPEPLTLSFTLGIDGWAGQTLFQNIPVLTDVGQETCINAACANPGYSAFIETLTDGRNGLLTGTFTVNSAGTPVSNHLTRVYESSFWPNSGTKDFQGYRIGEICLKVDSASVSQIPCKPTAVPEPGSCAILLLGMASAGLTWLRRARRSA